MFLVFPSNVDCNTKAIDYEEHKVEINDIFIRDEQHCNIYVNTSTK